MIRISAAAVRNLFWFSLAWLACSLSTIVFAATFTDTSCSGGEFDSATLTNVECVSNSLQLDATGLSSGFGTSTSQIFDGGGVGASWSSIAWSPDQPYGKELPSSTASDSGYTTGTIDMTNNILLLYMNESSWNGTVDEVIDSSGTGNDGVRSGDATTIADGVFSRAGTFDGAVDEIRLGTLGTFMSDMDSGMTMSFWVRWNHSNAWSAIMGGTNNGNTQTGGQVFINRNGDLGATDAGEIAFWFHDGTNTLSGGTGSGSSPDADINDGAWHHVALTATSLSPAGFSLYIDGEKQVIDYWNSGTVNITANFEDYSIGARYKGDTNTAEKHSDVDLDEVAFWDAAFTETDVVNIYRRGANRLRFQIRTCDDASCIGENFVGPDNTGNTYYTELTSSTNSGPNKVLAYAPDNQYFQYRVDFQSTSSSLNPILEDVSITYVSGSSAYNIPEFTDYIYMLTMLLGFWYAAKRVIPQEQWQS